MCLKVNNRGILIYGKPVYTSVEFYSGETYRGIYDWLEIVNHNFYRGFLRIRSGIAECLIIDDWNISKTNIFIKRKIEVANLSGKNVDGVQAILEIPLYQGNWIFFIPGACYKISPLDKDNFGVIVNEERLPFPLVLAYDEMDSRGILLLRSTPATWSENQKSTKGEYSFLHATSLGGIGYSRLTNKNGVLVCCIPYREVPLSRAFDKTLHPIYAFLPADPKRSIEVIYELTTLEASDYSEACRKAFCHAYSTIKPEPVNLPFNVYDALRYRTQCLADLAGKWDGYTGLKLNFDPRVSTETPPSGFGREFNKIKSDIFPSILEYGFTGRQLNNAYVLMYLGKKWNISEWVEIGKQVVESYITHCTTDSGFLLTLYDIERKKPFHPFNDPKGIKLHYGVPEALPGNYLRNMTEAAYDLVLCYNEKKEIRWLRVALDFGKFLMKIQNKDGTWYRAYTPDGKPITMPEKWFGYTPKQQKSATSFAIPCLVKLHKLAPEYGFLNAAERAGQWVIEESITNSDYRGGTLDNPNVVDKESMAYSMMSMLSLYEETGNRDYIKGAQKAGSLAITWNFIWDVPFEPGSRLYENNFKTRGWGGIDIIWAGSVVDIYSLWFVKDWYTLTELTGDSIYRDVAMLIVNGTQQMLAYPGNLYGLIGLGMQEEGFACSNLGLYEGMIKKGDTWGSLGWVYAAGTYGLIQVMMMDDIINLK
jgi:hypothetical protein